MEEKANVIYRMEAMQESAGNTDETWTASYLALLDDHRKELTCFNCQGTGHIGRDCPDPRTQEYTDFLDRQQRARNAERLERLAAGRNRQGKGTGKGGGKGDGKGAGSSRKGGKGAAKGSGKESSSKGSFPKGSGRGNGSR